MSILSILIIIIALLFIFFIIFLSLGLKIYLKLNKENDEFKADITVKLIVISIFSKKFTFDTNDIIKSLSQIKEEESDEKKEKTNKEDGNDLKQKLNDLKGLYPLITSNITYLFDFIAECIYSVQLQKFNTHISLGLSSFTDTATYTGYIWAFSAIPNLSNNFSLTAEPNFIEEAIDFESEIIFKIKLLKPFLATLKLFTRKSMLKLIWNLRVLIKW